jgi:hypothetical protein
MRQLGLSPPVELRPVATVIDQVTEEGDEDAEGIDTVHEADIEVQVGNLHNFSTLAVFRCYFSD